MKKEALLILLLISMLPLIYAEASSTEVSFYTSATADLNKTEKTDFSSTIALIAVILVIVILAIIIGWKNKKHKNKIKSKSQKKKRK